MAATAEVSGEQSIPSRVSVLSRLIPALSYAMPAAAAGLSSILFQRLMRAMSSLSWAGGPGTVKAVLSEVNLPTLIALYLAVILGVIGIVVAVIRLRAATTTASPSAWFFLIGGGLGLAPLLLFWAGESLFLEVMFSGMGVYSKLFFLDNGSPLYEVAARIQLCLTLALITSAVGVLILLVASLVPLPAKFRAKRNYAPLIVLVLMELLLVVMAAAFQIRTSWLHQVAIEGRM
jgi:hypothetical protein